MAWAEWMVVKPSLEEELQLESDSRAVLEDDNHEEVAKLCSVLIKQNWYHERLLKQCVGRVAELEAVIECMKPVVEEKIKRKSWLSIFSLNIFDQFR